MTTSGTDNFFLDNSDIVLEAFDRCQIRPTAITRQHMISATRSLNLCLQAMGNRGVNLWSVDLLTIPLVQGQATYILPSDTVSLLDAYRSTFYNTQTVSFDVSMTTGSGSQGVTVLQENHGLSAGYLNQFVVPVSVGGITVFGSYFITSVIDPNTYTIQAALPATSTVINGGAVPAFTAVNTSQTITVGFANHGLIAGESFFVQIGTTVGNQYLQGAFMVQSVVDVNNFTIAAPGIATVSETVSENFGQTSCIQQNTNQEPIDQFMSPISRSEYSSYATKFSQSPPTVYWFNRQTPNPTVTLWEVPDQNGPYLFKFYRMKRIQDAASSMGQTADIPYLFLDAICADMANRLARKYAPQLCQALALEAKSSMDEAMTENREYVDIFIKPQLAGYWQI